MPDAFNSESRLSAAPASAVGRFAVRRMRPEDAPAVARFHQEGIPTGVLAELGPSVLITVYRSLIAADDGFVFVGVDAEDRVVGFVAGVTDVGRMYRRVLHAHWLRFALLGVKWAVSPRMVRRIWNTLRYPARVEGTYPAAELLSIVVAETARGSGLASELFEALRTEFHRRGIERVKVMVGADLARANAYYRKHGCEPAGQILSHGRPANIYVINTNPR